MDDFEPKGFTGCSPFWTASVDHALASVHHASENVSRNPSVTLRRNPSNQYGSTLAKSQRGHQGPEKTAVSRDTTT